MRNLHAACAVESGVSVACSLGSRSDHFELLFIRIWKSKLWFLDGLTGIAISAVMFCIHLFLVS